MPHAKWPPRKLPGSGNHASSSISQANGEKGQNRVLSISDSSLKMESRRKRKGTHVGAIKIFQNDDDVMSSKLE